MNLNLNGKRALVGGSTQGLGFAVARQLADSGAEVVLLARNEKALQSVCAGLPRPFQQNHVFLVADFSRFDNFSKVVTDWFSENSVDILVNNTQGPPMGGAMEKSAADYQAAFDLLFQTVHCLSQLAIPGMKEKGFGRIINLASVTVREPLPHLVLSNTLRSAVQTWAKTLATAVAPFGITVNNILTGYFETERLKNIIQVQAGLKGVSAEEFKSTMVAGIPAGRLGIPEEMGSLVAFLVSERAGYITGTSIPLDGGYLRSI